MPVDNETVDVLVVGAGPTGLTMAAEALRHGLTCRIIERKPSRLMNQSKALVIHARSMEQLHAMGGGRVTERLCEAGTKMAKLRAHIGARGQHKRVHEFNEGSEEWGDTDFPFWLVIPQHRTECILEEELERLGGHVEWSTCLKSLQPKEAFVDNASALGPMGQRMSDVTALVERTSDVEREDRNEVIKCRWVIGCDGGRSFTRDQANIMLDRESSDAFFYLADIELGTQQAKEMFRGNEGNLFVHPEGVMAILPVEGNLYRIIAHESSRVNSSRSADLRESPEINKTFIDEGVRKRCNINIDTKRIAWSSIFRITYGVSNAYNKGGIFIAGDAAHVHSPIGGQGMNYGLQDATNLMWKIAWTKRIIESSSESNTISDNSDLMNFSINSILNSYCTERRSAAVEMMNGNKQATKVVTSKNPFIRFIRDAFLRRLFGGKRFRYMVSNSLSMLNLQYNSTTSPIIISESKTRRSRMSRFSRKDIWKPGSRLPNFTMCDGKKVYDKIGRTRHSWLVLHLDNSATQNNELPNTISTGPGMIPLFNVIVKRDQKVGNVLPQCILVRPDLYIAAVGEDTNVIWNQVLLSYGDASKYM